MHLLARLSYRHIDSMQCAHPNLRSAVSELVDNSRAAGADAVNIRHNLASEATPPQNHYFCVTDNGRGMSRDTLLHCVSMGYHVKHAGEDADISVSHYGHGAKAAPFFLGTTVIFASCVAIPKDTHGMTFEVTIMMLSREFHEAEPTPDDQLCIISVCYRTCPPGKRPRTMMPMVVDDDETLLHLEEVEDPDRRAALAARHQRNIILLRKYSHNLFCTEADLQNAFFDEAFRMRMRLAGDEVSEQGGGGGGDDLCIRGRKTDAWTTPPTGVAVFVVDLHDHIRKRYEYTDDDILETVQSVGSGAFLYDHEASLRKHLEVTYLSDACVDKDDRNVAQTMKILIGCSTIPIAPTSVAMHDHREEQWVPTIREWRADFGHVRVQVGYNKPEGCGAPSVDDRRREERLNRFNYTSGTFFYMRHHGVWRLVSFVPERVELHHSTGTSHRDREASGSGLVANVFLYTSCPSLIKPFTPNSTKTALVNTPEHHAFVEALKAQLRQHRSIIAKRRECRRHGIAIDADATAEETEHAMIRVRASRAIVREERQIGSVDGSAITGKRTVRDVVRFAEESITTKKKKKKMTFEMAAAGPKLPPLNKQHMDKLVSDTPLPILDGLTHILKRVAAGRRMDTTERRWATRFLSNLTK